MLTKCCTQSFLKMRKAPKSLKKIIEIEQAVKDLSYFTTFLDMSSA